MSVYAVSDLHGYYDLFVEGLSKIGFSDSDMLYVIGDAIDRGPDGIRLLLRIMGQDNMDLLLGNHELMMLNSVDPDGKKKCNGDDAELWLYYNGGNSTYRQYTRLSTKGRVSLLSWLRGRYLIKTLPMEGKTVCLTHSYYLPECENLRYDEADPEDAWKIVWNSIYRSDVTTRGEDLYDAYDYTFVTGHVPVQRVRGRLALPGEGLSVVRRRNLIDIDGGCAAGHREGFQNGALFFRLDDEEEFPVLMR